MMDTKYIYILFLVVARTSYRGTTNMIQWPDTFFGFI